VLHARPIALVHRLVEHGGAEARARDAVDAERLLARVAQPAVGRGHARAGRRLAEPGSLEGERRAGRGEPRDERARGNGCEASGTSHGRDSTKCSMRAKRAARSAASCGGLNTPTRRAAGSTSRIEAVWSIV